MSKHNNTQSEIFNVEQGEKMNQTARDAGYGYDDDDKSDNDGKKRNAGEYNNGSNNSSRSSSNNIV